MNQQQSQERPIYDRLPFFSILAGILGFLACCNPPLQLICGSTALILAWLSKKEQPLKPQAIVGIILGCICILFSFFIFFQYMWAMNIMEDPANAGIIKEIYRQTQEMLESMLPSNPRQSPLERDCQKIDSPAYKQQIFRNPVYQNNRCS